MKYQDKAEEIAMTNPVPRKWKGAKCNPKLLALILRTIDRKSNKVIDAFLGTSTIPHACKKMGFNTIGIDVLPSSVLRHRAFVGNSDILTDDDINILQSENPEKKDLFEFCYGHIFGKKTSVWIDNYISQIPKLSTQGKRDIATIAPLICFMKENKWNVFHPTKDNSITGFENFNDIDFSKEIIDFIKDKIPTIAFQDNHKHVSLQGDALELIPTLKAGTIICDPPYVPENGGSSSYESDIDSGGVNM